ncbi:MAG TPA: hypothetical protein VF715_05170 [Thermoleophilaceae bacterium]
MSARCLACGGRVEAGSEHVILIRGDLLHAGCALYSRQARR